MLRSFVDSGERGAQKIVSSDNTRTVVLDHVRLDQDPGTIAQRHVTGRETRRAVEVARAECQVTIVDEFEILGDYISGSFGCGRDFPAKNFTFPIEHGRIDSGVMLVVIPVSYTHLTLPTNREV